MGEEVYYSELREMLEHWWCDIYHTQYSQRKLSNRKVHLRLKMAVVAAIMLSDHCVE